MYNEAKAAPAPVQKENTYITDFANEIVHTLDGAPASDVNALLSTVRKLLMEKLSIQGTSLEKQLDHIKSEYNSLAQ